MASRELADPLWFKDAVIYQLHVKTFCDSNGDGIGDFPGLISKLGYLVRLGVTCLWLLPFYESPLRDDGYDVAHYERVHPHYGTREDFQRFLSEAHARGLRVITELVVNHTSDEHPWFQAARRAPPGSAKRDFYVWSDTDQKYASARVIFSDSERSNWTWDSVAGAYYWHRFFRHQPDLNFDNPQVRLAVLKVMRFWLDMGVDGLRLDAVAHLLEREGTTCDNLPETHAFLKEVRADLDARYSDRVLLAEVNQTADVTTEYFGDGAECQMAFNFPLMPRFFEAFAIERAGPIIAGVRETSNIPAACQWALFLRNHDELTLSALSEAERDRLLAAYAPLPRMRLNGGIRRRLAPLLGNSRPRIELALALMLSLPGSPIIYYGDEIGMGDDLTLADRDGVRTPMQWTAEPFGGFTRPDAKPTLPVIDDLVCGYRRTNVAVQDADSRSLLARVREWLCLRARRRAFGRGAVSFLETGHVGVLAFTRRWQDDTVLVVANLSRSEATALIDVSGTSLGAPLDASWTDWAAIDRGAANTSLRCRLPPYGVAWWELTDGAAPVAEIASDVASIALSQQKG